MDDYPLVWRVRQAFGGRYPCLPERFGQACRVVCRGGRGNVLVEFGDGYRCITSRWSVRKAADAPR